MFVPFLFVIRSSFVPVVSHFPLKVPKACVLNFTLNILYLIEVMLEFFLCKT